MKTYGVNWFLVWVGLLVFMAPLYAWLDLFLFSHWHSPPDSRGSAVAQAFCLTFFGFSCSTEAMVIRSLTQRL